MNKLYLSALLILAGTSVKSQLVSNGDFEQYTTCPWDYGQLDSALYWITPTMFKSSDLYNECSFSGSVDVPFNGGGYQQPHSGVGYAGIHLAAEFGAREYMETTLSSPLTGGVVYHVEMYANLSDISKYTTDAIGIYFSDTLVAEIPYSTNIPFPAQINNTAGVMFDTASWILVSGDFTAQGGEQYLLIGNFKDDLNTTKVLVSAVGQETAYVYVEDVSVSAVSAINEQANDGGVTVYPNPFANELHITIYNNPSAEITLYDVASKKILQQNFSGSAIINTAQLANGIYLYEVRNETGVIEKGKVVKQ